MQVLVKKKDFSLFTGLITELNIVPINVESSVRYTENNTVEEFLVSFRFTTLNDFLRCRSEILSTGLVIQIK